MFLLFIFSVSFVVLGDNRSNKPIEQPEVFKRIINEINVIGPDLVINVGDMILGYTDDTTLIMKEWNRFDSTIKRLDMEYHLTPGNHDVWDSVSQEIFLNRYGYLYKSFIRDRVLFIILNSEFRSSPDRIEGEQLEWLKQELKRPARFKFVFLHKPLWAIDSTFWYSKIHPILLRNRVNAVFAGHWHSYVFYQRDGIRYIITGGAGAPLNEFEKAGGFYHYLLVQAEDELRIAVIKPYSISPEDCIRFEDAQRIYQISNRCIGYPWVSHPVLSDSVNLTISNLFRFDLYGTIEIEESIFPFRVTGNETAEIRFPVPGLKELDWYPSPEILLSVNYQEDGDTIVVKRKVALIPEIKIKKQTVKIDGNLNDWTGIEWINLNEESCWGSQCGAKWGGRRDISGRIALSYDDQNLYFSALITDDIHDQKKGGAGMPEGDCLILAISSHGDPRRNDPDEDLKIIYFGLTYQGPTGFLYYPQGKGEIEYRIEISREEDQTIYEGSISRRAIKNCGWKRGEVLNLDLVITDSDGDSREGWLSLTPAMMTEHNTAFCLEGVLD
ncbi:MAG TPA: hypothetical protein EYP24_05045 [bacterium (Candidatus Stahlbacteria)]|nr:hypothetical protein [Candidatus Stahlbacteria bacterium]